MKTIKNFNRGIFTLDNYQIIRILYLIDLLDNSNCLRTIIIEFFFNLQKWQ